MNKQKVNIVEEIKLIIVDDNKEFNDTLKQILEKYDDITVLGNCYSGENEQTMIEELHPEIVITDLIRDGKKTGLELIKKYKQKYDNPKFLVITAEGNCEIDYNIIDGLIRKPIINYEVIVNQLRMLKQQIIVETLLISKENGRMINISNICENFNKKFRNNKKRKLNKMIKSKIKTIILKYENEL